MQNTITTPPLTTVESAVLQCVVYADLFDYALTPGEIWRWLEVPASRDEVDAALAGPVLSSLLVAAPPYVTLAGREDTAAVRERRKASSGKLRRQAERYGQAIARLPFVRMVAITGALAVDNADGDDDLDYLVVTAPGRVWLTRTMIMAIGRFAGLRGITLCPNYLIAETALALPAQDYYTARELLQMRPVAGQAVYERMLAENAWWRDYLPNFAHPNEVAALEPTGSGPAAGPDGTRAPDAGDPRPSFLRRTFESVLGLGPFDALERWILGRKGTELRRQAGGAEVVFDETMCKGHFDRWRERTQNRLQERLQSVLEGLR